MGFVVQNKHDKMSLRIFNQNSLLFRPFPPPPPPNPKHREEPAKVLPTDRPRYTAPIFPPSSLDLPLCLLQVS